MILDINFNKEIPINKIMKYFRENMKKQELTYEEKLSKFNSLGEMLKKENIFITKTGLDVIQIEDASSNFKSTHRILCWNNFDLKHTFNYMVGMRNSQIG